VSFGADWLAQRAHRTRSPTRALEETQPWASFVPPSPVAPESPKINPCQHGQFTTKDLKIHNGDRTVLSINDVGKTGQSHVKE